MISKIRSRIEFLFPFFEKNIFLKNVLYISGGTVFAQLLVLLFSPVISRIYSAEDLGVFQQYQAIISFLLVISGLRYEMAILIPKEKSDAITLLCLSILINLTFSVLIFILILVLHLTGYSFSLLAGMIKVVYFIPFALLGASVYQSLNNMIIREKEFKKIGITKMIQSSGLVGGQVVVGGFIDKPHGLIWGDLLSKFLGISTFVRTLLEKNKGILSGITWTGIKSMGHAYRKFPLISVPSGLINVAGLTMSTFLIGNYFGLSILGFYALVDRLFAAPSMLIGQSVSQVYMGDFVDMANSNPEALLKRFKYLIKKIGILAFVPYTLAAVLAPFIFGWIFGREWNEAGIFFAILAPMQFVSIIVWPLIPTLNLLERQNWQLGWDFFRLIFVSGVLFLSHHFNLSARMSIFLYGSTMLFFYISHLVLSYFAITFRIRQFKASSGI
jgi:O-antigen/teichoic acid export membrane protein